MAIRWATLSGCDAGARTYLTDTLVACPADHRYDITDIPTEETFLGSWDTARSNPYNQLPAVPSRIEQDCPPN